MQEDLNAASDMNDRLADQVEELDAQLDTLKQHYEDLQKQYTQKSAELADYSRQASADFKSYVAQSQSVEEVLNSKIESLRSQRQASHVQVQSLQRELEAAYAQISSLQFQYGGPQQEGRLQVGQDLRLVTRSNSFGTPMRSPRSPSGSSTSSGTSRGARGIDFQVSMLRGMLSSYTCGCICNTLWPAICWPCSAHLHRLSIALLQCTCHYWVLQCCCIADVDALPVTHTSCWSLSLCLDSKLSAYVLACCMLAFCSQQQHL